MYFFFNRFFFFFEKLTTTTTKMKRNFLYFRSTNLILNTNQKHKSLIKIETRLKMSEIETTFKCKEKIIIQFDGRFKVKVKVTSNKYHSHLTNECIFFISLSTTNFINFICHIVFIHLNGNSWLIFRQFFNYKLIKKMCLYEQWNSKKKKKKCEHVR